MTNITAAELARFLRTYPHTTGDDKDKSKDRNLLSLRGELIDLGLPVTITMTVLLLGHSNDDMCQVFDSLWPHSVEGSNRELIDKARNYASIYRSRCDK